MTRQSQPWWNGQWIWRLVPLYAAIASTISACAATPKPCATTGSCGEGKLCLAGSCVPKNHVPASSRAQRHLLSPTEIAVLSSQGEHPWPRGDVPFGQEAVGRLILLLRFPNPLPETANVESAHIVLESIADSRPGTAPVFIELSRVLAPWSAQATSWERLPPLSPAESRWLASTWGQRKLLIDVTPQIRRWQEHRSDDHGLALVSSPQDPIGAHYALGTVGGSGPKLDLYVR